MAYGVYHVRGLPVEEKQCRRCDPRLEMISFTQDSGKCVAAARLARQQGGCLRRSCWQTSLGC